MMDFDVTDESLGTKFPKDKLFPSMESSISEIVAKEIAKQREQGIEKILNLHVRALACHCECLGMNAENAIAVCGNYTPPYNDADYYSVMQKWGLMNEKGEPTI